MASGALPPAFAPVRIGDKAYWYGGLVSNTPLEPILGEWPRQDTLALQVDLWSARRARPQNMMDVFERVKYLQYSRRPRHGQDPGARHQHQRSALAEQISARHDSKAPGQSQDTMAPWR